MFAFHPVLVRLPGRPTLLELLSAWRDQPGLIGLDSAAGEQGWRGGGSQRWSLVGLGPRREPGCPLDLAGVRRVARSLTPGASEVPGPYAGGFLGALAYDLGVVGERLDLPADPWCSPPVIGGLTTDFAVLDHSRDEAWLVLDEAADDGRAPWKERRDQLLTLLAEGGRTAPVASAGELVRHVTAAEHIARIERARGWIAEGEFYQVNLAQHFTRATQGHPVDLYTRLRRANPGGYNAYVSWGPEPWPTGALLSTSPELLLAVDGRRATTRPIKGTTARSTDPVEDAAAVAALRASAKERAELAMIVDLERNDLGRVATPGSVTVGEFPEVESYRNLHHLVAEVSAELRSGLDGGDALEALFPGGSITGAPKLRAMAAIAELEGEGRGFFSGSAGFLDHRGHALWNILIRTAQWRSTEGPSAGEVSLRVGGGITWASVASEEERESRLKGTLLARALAPQGDATGLGPDLTQG